VIFGATRLPVFWFLVEGHGFRMFTWRKESISEFMGLEVHFCEGDFPHRVPWSEKKVKLTSEKSVPFKKNSPRLQ
jgi:hypothetical protein